MTVTRQAGTPTSSQAQFFDYSSAANPLQKGLISRIPYRCFPASFFDQAGTELKPLDLSEELECEGPATGPSLCGNFIRLDGDSLRTSADATSQLFFVARGEGRSQACGQTFHWTAGDTFVLPAGGEAIHSSDSTAGLYWVHDAPLLRYLGVSTVKPIFEPCFYSHRDARAELDAIARNPRGANANRVSVLLGNNAFPQTRTVTHTLWAMLGILPSGQVQRPHRHQSIALDFAVACKPGCYTLIGTELDDEGMICNGHREDWVAGAAFVTPPGYWHSHHNESGADAYVLPIQDAGLHTCLRTLDIAFSRSGGKSQPSNHP